MFFNINSGIKSHDLQQDPTKHESSTLKCIIWNSAPPNNQHHSWFFFSPRVRMYFQGSPKQLKSPHCCRWEDKKCAAVGVCGCGACCCGVCNWWQWTARNPYLGAHSPCLYQISHYTQGGGGARGTKIVPIFGKIATSAFSTNTQSGFAGTYPYSDVVPEAA